MVAGSHQAMVSWLLTVIFVLLLIPCVQRVTRPDVLRTGRHRDSDLAELLLTLAMVAMLSPVGGPIPAAGWQAVLLLVATYFLWAFLRDRRVSSFAGHGAHGHGGHGHVANHAVLMFYMLTAMPHEPGMSHGPWFTMAGMDPSASLALPALAIAGAVALAADAALCGTRLVRSSAGAGAWYSSREAYRATMGLGMAYSLVAAI